MRSLARWAPRRVASLAMITMPEISPPGLRSGAAWARTKTRDPSSRWLASVPSQGQPLSTFSAMCWTVATSPCSMPSDSSDWPTRCTGSSGKPNSETAKEFAYSSAQSGSVTTMPVAIWARTSLSVSGARTDSSGVVTARLTAIIAAAGQRRARQSRLATLSDIADPVLTCHPHTISRWPRA